MNEQEFDPKDLNKDGKVSVKEILLSAADKANEAIGEAAQVVKKEVGVMVDKVKEYNALSPEEKKAKQDEWNGKLTEAAEKATDSLKEVVEEVKEGARKTFGSGKGQS